MLISFGAKNFYCFKEEITIDLSFGSKVPKQFSSGNRLATAICLKGANASGKTNAVKILNFLSKFCANSFGEKPDAEIEVESFFGNNEPIDIFINFQINDIIYNYELQLKKDGVISEKIFRKEKRKTLVFSREKSSIKINNLSEKKEFPIRNNASIISTLYQFEDPGIAAIYTFFNKIYTNVDAYGFHGKTMSYNFCAGFYERNPEQLEFTKEWIKKFDTGIADIQISSYKDNNDQLISFPIYLHETADGIKQLIHANQSSGTKSLFSDLLLYGFVLRSGGILALDEFDINLHPDILPHLIRMFEDPIINKHNSQIIISTHNNEIIDILGKYRTVLFNKREGESFCYRLDEIESDLIRNDRPILPLYIAGKIGGTPRI